MPAYNPSNAFDQSNHYSDELIRLLVSKHGWRNDNGAVHVSLNTKADGEKVATLRTCGRRRYFWVAFGWSDSSDIDGREYTGDLNAAAKILTHRAKELVAREFVLASKSV
jgi:hypothetical protein